MSAGFADEPLEGARARIEPRPGGVLVSMPAKRYLFALLFFPVWLVFWSYGWITDTADAGPFIVIGPLASAVAVVVWLWMLAGREDIEVAGGRLTLRRRLGPLKREKHFDTGRIEDLRALEMAGSRWNDSTGLTHASMAFDYGARTHKFASALDEAEAKHVARKLEEALR